MAAFQQFYSLVGQGFSELNTALVTMLPKKEGATSVVHSQTHCKNLAIWLSKVINNIISSAQTAFLKSKCVHDSFMYVHNGVKLLHRRKTPAVLLKLDITRAFDSVSWEYLLELLQNLGFSARWRDWIALLLSTSSSVVMLNGCPKCSCCTNKGCARGTPSHRCYSFWQLIHCIACFGLQQRETS